MYDPTGDPMPEYEANRMSDQIIPSDGQGKDCRRGHNRWNSVSTILSSLFGLGSHTDGSINEVPTNSRNRQKRVRIKGMYGFFLHREFSSEVGIWYCH
jgi:hypothetical protein